MKKTQALLLFIVSLLSFLSCSKEMDERKSDAFIVGTWNIDKTIYTGYATETGETGIYEVRTDTGSIRFDNDLTGIWFYDDDSDRFLWSITDDILYLQYIDDDIEETYTIIHIDRKKMSWFYEEIWPKISYKMEWFFTKK